MNLLLVIGIVSKVCNEKEICKLFVAMAKHIKIFLHVSHILMFLAVILFFLNFLFMQGGYKSSKKFLEIAEIIR